MAEIYFVSDTHFCHGNLIHFEGGRPEFSCADEMNETMISRWNSVIREQDKVYHLGDVTFRYDGKFKEIMSRLKGHKRLIVGNHDHIKNPALQIHFEKIDLWTGGKFKHLGFIGSHVPIHPGHFGKWPLNVHGHTHRRFVMETLGELDNYGEIPDPRYMNICVEQTDYTPIHVDVIIERVKEL